MGLVDDVVWLVWLVELVGSVWCLVGLVGVVGAGWEVGLVSRWDVLCGCRVDLVGLAVGGGW